MFSHAILELHDVGSRNLLVDGPLERIRPNA